MKKYVIYVIIALFLCPLYGTAKRRNAAKRRENNHSALLYCREFGPLEKGFVYLFCDTLNKTFVFMKSYHDRMSSAEYGTCRINGDTLILTPVVYSDTFLRLFEYVKANTDLSDDQINKELDMVFYGKYWPELPSDTIKSLVDKWRKLRNQPVERPIFRVRDSIINNIANYPEYRYIMKRHKLINITEKKVYPENVWQQELYRVDLPVPDEYDVLENRFYYIR